MLRAGDRHSFGRPSGKVSSLRKHPAPDRQGLGLVCMTVAVMPCFWGLQRPHGAVGPRAGSDGHFVASRDEPRARRPRGPQSSHAASPPAQDGRVRWPITEPLTPWGRAHHRPSRGPISMSQGSRCLKSFFKSFCKNIWARAGPLHPLPHHHPQGSAATSSSTNTNTCDPPRARAGAPHSSRGPGFPPSTCQLSSFPSLTAF